jgi:dimethylglycine dehydrogenase
LKNYFCCNGIIPGFSQSGGMGLLAAEWIIQGETKYDMFAWDMARFGDWADAAFTKARVGDQYAHRFKIHFPNEERDAGRPIRTRPIFEKQRELGATFGLNYGWEHALYFDSETPETAGFTRQGWWHSVGREAQMLRDSVGVIDISNFGKYSVKGAGAEEWLNEVFANKMPSVVGRSCLTPLIGKRGGIAGDATVTKLGEDEYWVVSSGMAERYQKRFYQMVDLPEGTTFESKTNDTCAFNVAGPKSRELLQRLSNADLSNAAWPFMRSGHLTIAGVECAALRISFTGDLGWEIYCDVGDQLAVYTALIDAAAELGGGPVGSRALMSLRVEKGYGSWSREYSPEYWPQEVGLERLCKMDKDFLNKSAAAEVMQNEPRENLVLIHIDEDAVTASNADATGGEPIFKDGVGIGRVTSGAYGYSVGMSLALGYVKNASAGDLVQVMILGKPHGGTILAEPPFDHKGERLRG